MAYEEFSGELDKPTGFEEFTGKLDSVVPLTSEGRSSTPMGQVDPRRVDKPEEPGIIERITNALPMPMRAAVRGLQAVADSDIVKSVAGPAVSGTLSVPQGLEKGARGAARRTMNAENTVSDFNPTMGFSVTDTPADIYGQETAQEKAQRALGVERALASVPSLPGAKALAEYGDKVQKQIEDYRSPEVKKAIKESQVTGNIFKGEIDFGSNPSAQGYFYQAVGVLGSMAPMVLTTIVTKSPTAGGAAGGASAAAEGARNAQDAIAQMSDDQLAQASPFFRQMIEGGASPQEARDLTSRKASESAGILQGIVATFGDKFTAKLITEGLGKTALKVAGKSTLGRIGVGTGLSAGEQGVQEVGEGVASDIGISTVLPDYEIGKDSAGNLVLGALGGLGPGGLSGARRPAAEEQPPSAEQMARDRGFLQPSAPINFTEPDSPSAQAGLAPIVVPVAPAPAVPVDSGEPTAPLAAINPTTEQQFGLDQLRMRSTDVGTTGASAPVADGRSDAGGNQSVGGMGVPRPGNAVTAGGVERTAASAASNVGSTAVAGDAGGQRSADLTAQNNNAVVQPSQQWFGRKGDGYVTQADAQQALPGRQRMFPTLDWKVEQMPSGKFRLAGYEAASAQQVAPAATGQGLPAAGTATGALETTGLNARTQEIVNGVTPAQAVQAEAQRQEAPAPAASTPSLTAAQFMQDPAAAIATAQRLTFAPGQLAAVKVSDRKKLAAAFEVQEMDDGSTVFVRMPAPQGQAVDQQAAIPAAPDQNQQAAGAVVGSTVASTQPAAASQAGGVDAATIAADLAEIEKSHLERYGSAVSIEAIDPSMGTTGLAALVARKFRAPITFIRAKSGAMKFNGSTLNGRLYISEDGESAPVAVAIHEVGHNLPADIKQKMISGVMQTVTPQQRARFLKEFSGYAKDTKERQDEELVMRIIEQDAQNPQFWQKLADRMGNNDFAQLAKEILRVLDRIISGFTKEDSSEFTTDIEKVRDLVADAYAEARGRISAQMEADKAASSTATLAPSIARAPETEVRKAEAYEKKHGILPYTSEGQLDVPVETLVGPQFSVKREGKYGNHPLFDIPVNKNGTVTLYYPTTNEEARRVAKDKTLRAAPGSNRIYLTNESSAPKVMTAKGNIEQELEGANVLVQVDPSLLQLDMEHADGRKDFFVPVAEGQEFFRKMKMTRLFTQNAPRTKALTKDTKLTDLERRITDGVEKYLALTKGEQKIRLKEAKTLLKREHNVTTLLGVNGKLEKTNTGGYGLNNYQGKDVKSMGLGLASAQKINENNLSTCPKSAICESLCLGETSGQNQLYGGEGDFKSGPRLAQYLKTEAMVVHPEEFSIVLHSEIAKLQRDAQKEDYQATVRLNVTSDFRPQTFKAIIDAFPDVMFYDYTKLPSRSIADNHHLTYSSTGASQSVAGRTVVNQESNWNKMVEVMRRGDNVAMAFSDKNTMPKYVVDEKTGERFQVWDGDNYDARFLDPKPDQEGNEFGKGMIVGLTNKDRTRSRLYAALSKEGPEAATPKEWQSIVRSIANRDEMAGEKYIPTVLDWLGDQRGPISRAEIAAFADNPAVKHGGFFIDYNPERDGDTVVIKHQDRLASGAKFVPIKVERNTEAAQETESAPMFSEQRGRAVDDGTGIQDVAYSGYVNAEVPRVQAARKLGNLIDKLDDGKVTAQSFELQVRMLADRLAAASTIKRINREANVDLERGADIVREKLLAARRRGEIPADTTEFVLWALAQNPAIAEGLAISVKEAPAGKAGTAGDYNPAMALMRVFKGNANVDTGVHEILHHGERLMPGKVQDGIRKEWSRAYSKALADATGAQRQALEQILPAMAGDEDAQKALTQAFKDGVLTKDEHYQLVNPSEYWAVNATAILRRRYEAGSWIADAKRWLGEMLEKVKGLIGMRSDAPLLRGLQAVLSTDGERQSKKMLANVSEFNDSAVQQDAELEQIFTDLQDARGLKLVRVNERVAEHPMASQIEYVNANFYDILEQLDDAGLIQINCK